MTADGRQQSVVGGHMIEITVEKLFYLLSNGLPLSLLCG